MIVAILLAAGRGTRLKSTDRNKVTLPFLNKPMIVYGVELMLSVSEKVVVVVGAFAKSVEEVLKDYDVVYAVQKEQMGTAHAVKIGLEKIQEFSPSLVLVGYGDHTMFYRKETIENLIDVHKKENAAISIVTTLADGNSLAWGRVIRDSNGRVVDNVEHKDATDEQKKIRELNAGFYCFDYLFLKDHIDLVPQSPVSHEYYINSLIKIAVDRGKKVSTLVVPFDSVGIGINRPDELAESQKIYLGRK